MTGCIQKFSKVSKIGNIFMGIKSNLGVLKGIFQLYSFFQFLQNKKMSKIYFSRDSEKYSEFCNSHVAPFKEHNVWVPKYESIHEFLNKKQEEYDDEDRHEMRTGKNGNMRDRWEYYEDTFRYLYSSNSLSGSKEPDRNLYR